MTAVRNRARACRNELRSLFLGITDGTPEFVPAADTTRSRATDDAAMVASLCELTDRGCKILGSRDVLVLERCRRMHLDQTLLDQAESLIAELRSVIDA